LNLFILDYDKTKCAQYYNNRHLVKIILEATQLLNNALIQHNVEYSKNPIYKQTHKNHPLSKWCAENISNFQWTLDLALELCKEYFYRYNKVHKCQKILEKFNSVDIKSNLPSGNISPFKLCMPEKYHTKDVVESYRLYYLNDKRHLAAWKNREKPEWWI